MTTSGIGVFISSGIFCSTSGWTNVMAADVRYASDLGAAAADCPAERDACTRDFATTCDDMLAGDQCNCGWMPCSLTTLIV